MKKIALTLLAVAFLASMSMAKDDVPKTEWLGFRRKVRQRQRNHG